MRRQASPLLDSRLAAIEAGATLAGHALVAVAVAVAVSAAVAEVVVVASVAPVVAAAATATDKLVLFFRKENGSVSHFQANFRAVSQ